MTNLAGIHAKFYTKFTKSKFTLKFIKSHEIHKKQILRKFGKIHANFVVWIF